MEPTTTSSLSTGHHVAHSDIRLSAFGDELVKIAEAQSPRPTFKRWLKNTALIGSGYAVGHGLGMVAERGAQKLFGQRWAKWSTPAKSRLIHAGAGLAAAGAFVSAENLIRQRAKAEQG
jgi:hypothetical protein